MYIHDFENISLTSLKIETTVIATRLQFVPLCIIKYTQNPGPLALLSFSLEIDPPWRETHLSERLYDSPLQQSTHPSELTTTSCPSYLGQEIEGL